MLIHAPRPVVWRALTEPGLIKQYFFGTDVITTWQVGSPIRFSGSWEGKAYEDKGSILHFEPEREIRFDYFSSWSGQEDSPGNRQVITYRVTEQSGATLLLVQQENCPSEEARLHSEENWRGVLNGLRELSEKIQSSTKGYGQNDN